MCGVCEFIRVYCEKEFCLNHGKACEEKEKKVGILTLQWQRALLPDVHCEFEIEHFVGQRGIALD